MSARHTHRACLPATLAEWSGCQTLICYSHAGGQFLSPAVSCAVDNLAGPVHVPPALAAVVVGIAAATANERSKVRRAGRQASRREGGRDTEIRFRQWRREEGAEGDTRGRGGRKGGRARRAGMGGKVDKLMWPRRDRA